MYNLEELLRSDERRSSLTRQVLDAAPADCLRSLKLKIISNCNLRCEMCRYWQMPKQQLPRTVIFSTLEHAAALGCIKVHLSGGEVTLHHDLVDAIRHGTELGMRMNLTSNGVLMDKPRARQWVEAGLRAASFSLDGVRRKTHDGIRGVPGAYKRTLRAIRVVVRENERLGGKLRVRVNTVMSAKNMDELPALLELVGAMGVVDVMPMPIDGKRAIRPTVKQIARFNAEIAPRVAEIRRRYHMPIDAGRLYPFGRTAAELDLATQGRYGFGHYDQHRCYAPYYHAFISHTGEVFACCMTRDRMRPLGNVREQTLSDIFLGSAYQAFRQGMNVARLPVCANCDQYLRENRLVDARLAESAPPRLRLPIVETV